MTDSNVRKEDIELTQEQVDRFCELIHEEAGLNLDKRKYRIRLTGKIKDRMIELGLDDPDEYYDEVWFSQNSNREMRNLINACVVNETLFYRNEKQMEILENRVFPDLLRRRKNDRNNPIRVLSAGCSNGAEPFSIIMAYLEASRQEGMSPETPGINVIGLDISTEALMQAREGKYGERTVRNAPERIQNQYFNRTSNGQYEVIDEVQERTTFRYLNLVDSSPPEKRDIVFHRNVLIYFESYIRDQVIEKLHRCLKQDGLLFLGHSEDFKPYSDYFQPTDWEHQQIFKKWTTDRRTSSIWDREERLRSESKHDERRENVREKDPPTIREQPPSFGGDYQRIILEGVVDRNILREDFNEELYRVINPDQDRYVFDLSEVDYITNAHLFRLGNVVESLVEERKKVHIVSDEESVRKWTRKSFSSPSITFSEQSNPKKIPFETREKKTEPKSSRRVHRSSQTRDKETVVEEKSKDRETESDSDRGSGSYIDSLLEESSEESSPTEKIEVHSKSDRIELKLKGRLDSENQPELIRLVKEEITNCMSLIEDDSHDRMEIDLNSVKYIDRSVTRILRRSERMASSEDVELEVNCDRSEIRNTLDRWGCSFVKEDQ